MSEAQDNKAVHASVLLAQFNTLRDEIKTRSTAQAALLTANITAIGVIGGFVFSDKGQGADVLLVIPILSPMLGMLWIDHAISIACIGTFLQRTVTPALAKVIGVPALPDYEEKVRELEARTGLRVFVFGFPIFLLFAVLPMAALLYALLQAADVSSPSFWGPALLGVSLVVIFVAMWARLVWRPGEAWLASYTQTAEAR